MENTQTKAYEPDLSDMDNGFLDDGFQDVPMELAIEAPCSVDDLDYLRYFIIHSGNYVEELECTVCERSDTFWDVREHAYRIVTAMLIEQWERECH